MRTDQDYLVLTLALLEEKYERLLKAFNMSVEHELTAFLPNLEREMCETEKQILGLLKHMKSNNLLSDVK